MHTETRNRPRRLSRSFGAAVLACLLSGAAYGADSPSAALRSKYTQLSSALAHNQFKRPLALDSIEAPGRLTGDIYALVDYPYATVNEALNDAGHWCDVLILHLNTKYCHMLNDGGNTVLQVAVGKKFDQPLTDAYRVDFAYKTALSEADYFSVDLSAKKGPLGTSNYRIVLEAVALPNQQTFLHLTYSYAYNFVANIAMQGYLATVGSDKVGFTRVDGTGYIGGVRGVVERNTMRYYLAIDAYLGGLKTAPAEQFEQRLQTWFAATEHYPQQLHEVDKNTYLAMKRSEYARQQTAQ